MKKNYILFILAIKFNINLNKMINPIKINQSSVCNTRELNELIEES